MTTVNHLICFIFGHKFWGVWRDGVRSTDPDADYVKVCARCGYREKYDTYIRYK